MLKISDIIYKLSRFKAGVKMQKEKSSISGGLFWTFGERIASQIVSTIITIVLARILLPEYYGMISIVTIFISLCDVFVISGMGTALVQKKTVDEEDYNTAFIISMSIAVLLYIILFFLAPTISKFYMMDALTLVIRVMALRLPLAAINCIQQAHVQRAMVFKRFFIATLSGTLMSGVVGLYLAMNGYGVWALVFQYLTNTTVNTIVLFFVEKWIPKLQFSLDKAKEIYSFGWKVLATELVYTLENNMCGLIIGKIFGAADLAFFDQGKKYPAILVNNINSAISKVMLPAYSRYQDDVNQLKNMLRKTIAVGGFLLTPILIGFAVISETFIKVVLTEKWMFCSPYIKIFCFMYLTRPLETACHQALLGMGKSDIVLRIMLIIHSIDFVLLLIAAFIFKSVFIIAVCALITTFVSLNCFMYYSNKIIGYKLKEQVQDICPVIFCSIAMGGVVSLIGLLLDNLVMLLVIQITIGTLVYIALAKMVNLTGFQYIYKKFYAKKK